MINPEIKMTTSTKHFLRLFSFTLILFLIGGSQGFSQTQKNPVKPTPVNNQAQYRAMHKMYKAELANGIGDKLYKAYLEDVLVPIRKAKNWMSMDKAQRTKIQNKIQALNNKYNSAVQVKLTEEQHKCVQACMDRYPLGENDCFVNRAKCYKNCK